MGARERDRERMGVRECGVVRRERVRERENGRAREGHRDSERENRRVREGQRV